MNQLDIVGPVLESTSTIIVHARIEDGEEGRLLTIFPDGRIERGPAFTTDDEASLLFWDAVSKAIPSFHAAVRASLREESA